MIKFSILKIKKNRYTYFILKLIILFTMIFVLDYSIGNMLRYYYFRQQSGMLFRTTYSIEDTKANLLIFGSSRANHDYYPNIFENRFNLSYYSVGRDGSYLFYHYAVLKGILKRYTPKIVILDFKGGEFSQDPDSYTRISSLLPYYKSHPEMRSIIELKSTFEKFKLLSSIYPYNSSMFTIAIGNIELNKKRRGDIKGYIPLTNRYTGLIETDGSPVKYETDSTKIIIYKAFIQDCIHSKIKLYIVCSPSLIKTRHTDYSILLAQQIAKNNNVPFFDYSTDSRFINSPWLFSDIVHLNNEGARAFSNILIDTILKYQFPLF